MARLILLTEWAKDEFSAPVPTPSTLSKYAKAGMIFPLPKKVGRHWRVDPKARFVGMVKIPEVTATDHPALKRILEDGSSPKI
ncbi:excisionase [Salmonella enterica subsp. enterica]|nr:excisionase [Salmonella enterica subsp. enterica]EGW8417149.1 excisionase [Salmonella enterica]